MTKQERNRKYNQSENGKLRNAEFQKKYRSTNKGKKARAIRQQRYLETIKGRALQLYTSAKKRAKQKNLPFTITREWIENKLSTGECEVTGTPIHLTQRLDVQSNPFAPSLDQKIVGNGYTPENAQIVAVWYNRMKNDLTDGEALEILIESHAGIIERLTPTSLERVNERRLAKNAKK
jgi:hypothetical protein